LLKKARNKFFPIISIPRECAIQIDQFIIKCVTVSLRHCNSTICEHFLCLYIWLEA